MPRYGNSFGSSGASSSLRGRSGNSSGAFDSWMSNQFTYTDAEYLQEIEQYKDKPWYNYLLTNPWMWSKQGQFSPNLWNSISSVFGDNSAEANYFNQIKSNRSQWLSEFIEKMRQQDYNEPIAQVQRDIQAGLNPDLVGNVDSGSASENDQPLIDTPVSGFGSEDLVPKLGQFFMSIYSLASGFAKDMFSFQSMQNELTSQDLAINEKIVSATTDFIKGSIGAPKLIKDDSGDTRFEFPDLSLDKLDDYANTMFRSRSTRKRFKKEVQSSYQSARSNFIRYGVLKSEEDAKRALAQSIGQTQGVGGDFETIVDISSQLFELGTDIERLNRTYTKSYYEKASGSLAGEAANSQNQGIIDENKARSYQRKMDEILNRRMENIISSLEKTSKSGGFEGLLAKGMLMYLSAFRLQMIPQLPNVNLSGLVQSKNFYNTTNNNLLE